MTKKIDVRSILLKYAQSFEDTEVAVLLSGGIDSASVMFSMLEAGKKVIAYSFMLNGKMSSDFAYARRNARNFNCEFVSIILPDNIETLKLDLIDLQKFGARTKTDFECGWPMLYAYRQITQKIIASGMGADGHFCISKKGMIHYRDRIDEFRLGLYRNPNYAQAHIHKALAKKFEKTIIMPYLTDDMQQMFLGTTWNQVNKPRQKQPILDSYPIEFSRIKIRPHINLQLGDSGIAQHFFKLLKTNWNKRNYKSPVGIYNLITSGVIK